MTSSPLILAVPSKGRLKEQFDRFMSKADMPISNLAGRGYSGRVRGLPGLEVRFLSASEIARAVTTGEVHLGVTGRDLVEELLASQIGLSAPARVTELGFGQARVIVAVPNAWVDVETMADLADIALIMSQSSDHHLRVATKYIHLTRQFFASKSIGAYRVVESLGATEGAPRAGSADLIVDITETGSTLRANQLRILNDGEILASEAFLYASSIAPFHDDHKFVLKQLLDRLEARLIGSGLREVRAALADEPIELTRLMKRFQARQPWPVQPLDHHRKLVTLHVALDQVPELVSALRDLNAGQIVVSEVIDLYCEESVFYSALEPRLTNA